MSRMYSVSSDEEDLLRQFSYFGLQGSGVLMQPNSIGFDEDTLTGHISYVVEDGAPPIRLVTGESVRVVSLTYDYEELKNGRRH